MTKLEKAISKVIHHCLQLKPHESLLILADELTYELGNLLLTSALRISENSILVEMERHKRDNHEPSTLIESLMKQMNVNIIATSTALNHTKALRTACHHGARILSLSKLSLETISRCVNTDYDYIIEKSQWLADLLSIGKVVTLTTPAGTDIKIPIYLRKGIADTGITCEPGIFTSMPAGKAAITPEREKAEGVIVVDGSLGSLGMVRNPIELRIRNGNITKIFGSEEALFLRKTLRIHGKNTRCIAELGIGTNPNATLTGESEEDEKTLGTVYLTLGNSMPDGSEDERHAPVNLILRKPSLKIDGRPIIENGTLLV